MIEIKCLAELRMKYPRGDHHVWKTVSKEMEMRFYNTSSHECARKWDGIMKDLEDKLAEGVVLPQIQWMDEINVWLHDIEN